MRLPGISQATLLALFALTALNTACGAVSLPQRDRAVAASADQAPTLDTDAVPTSPVAAAQRFPDPAILVVDTRYYAYATRNGAQNIPVMLSTDLTRWTLPIDALPRLPQWAGGRTWAPSVIRRGEQYAMWYTVRDRASARQCISVATADGPLGPFVDNSSGPAICQPESGGSIDPEVFIDTDGDAYLLWKSDDNALGQPTTLWGAPLSPEGNVAGAPMRLLSGTPGWHANLIEGPAMATAAGKYFLFYGANRWNTAAAAIGFAECKTPLGPCTDATAEAPWLASVESALGPSGPHIFRDAEGKHRIAYHAWDQCVGSLPCNRALYFGTLAFSEGRPLIRS